MIEVTAAIIKRGDKILIARRPKDDHLSGLWEFPGGKIEFGETPEECLRREIYEELNINIKVKDFCTESLYAYPKKEIRLMAYWAEWISGEVITRVHDEVRWITVVELSDFSFAPADIPIVEKIRGVLNV